METEDDLLAQQKVFLNTVPQQTPASCLMETADKNKECTSSDGLSNVDRGSQMLNEPGKVPGPRVFTSTGASGSERFPPGGMPLGFKKDFITLKGLCDT